MYSTIPITLDNTCDFLTTLYHHDHLNNLILYLLGFNPVAG